MDDRMAQEDQKSVAASIFGGGSMTESAGGGVPDNSVSHPDRQHVMGIFGESSHAVPQQATANVNGGLDLSAITAPQATPGRQGIREDLVQQAAQSLVRDKNDAFLAITNTMTPDEISVTLATARQWRRSDPNWQDTFRSAPETGFKFIDRTSGAPKNKVKTAKPNKAEALAKEILTMMRENKLDPAETPKVVRTLVKDRGLTMTERQLAMFSSAVANAL